MERVFHAVLEDAIALSKLLSQSPHLARVRAEEDHLVQSIPHWLYSNDTPLHLAAAALRVDAARQLLENGADANAQNRRGATPLHYACDPRPNSGGVWDPEAQCAVIDLLIRHSAKVDHADKGGASPLHRAVRARSAAAVGSLLQNGANVHVRLGKLGSSPLHLAVQSTGAGGTAGTVEEQLEIIHLLLEHGAQAKATDNRGSSVFDWTKNERITSVLKSRSR